MVADTAGKIQVLVCRCACSVLCIRIGMLMLIVVSSVLILLFGIRVGMDDFAAPVYAPSDLSEPANQVQFLGNGVPREGWVVLLILSVFLATVAGGVWMFLEIRNAYIQMRRMHEETEMRQQTIKDLIDDAELDEADDHAVPLSYVH